jgi:hypothetical protein
MSDLNDRIKSRCPRKLGQITKEWCPLAVLRLKTLRASKKELSEEEEAKLPGCPWAIDDQMSGYCWFAYEAHNMPETPSTDVDIAAMLHVSTDTVKKTAERAINKIQNCHAIKEIRESFADEPVVDSGFSLDDETAYCE